MTDNFHDALAQLGPQCPHCGEDRQLERVSNGWLCNVCSKTFLALSTNDKRFLKAIHVEPSD